MLLPGRLHREVAIVAVDAAIEAAKGCRAEVQRSDCAARCPPHMRHVYHLPMVAQDVGRGIARDEMVIEINRAVQPVHALNRE